MIDAFLFVGLPYIALVVVRGRLHLARPPEPVTRMSARSSQFLEDRQLLWGSTPWHIGILVVLLGHIIAGFLPRVWSSILTVPGALFAIEALGVACSLLALTGLGILIYRRITSARIQAVTTTRTLLVVALLVRPGIGRAALGDPLSATVQPGAPGPWCPISGASSPCNPDMTYVTGFPMLFKLHLSGAWLLILLVALHPPDARSGACRCNISGAHRNW